MRNPLPLTRSAALLAAASIFTLASLTLPVAHAAAPSPELRLIQTSDNHREWMTGEQIGELARLSHLEGHCGGFIDVTDHADATPIYTRSLGLFEDRAPTHPALVNRLIGELSNEKLMGVVDHLSSYQNRFYKSDTGVQSAQWIRDEFVRLAKGRTDVSVELFKHPRFSQPSVIARIAGKGAKAKEHVVIGAHEDSVNWSLGMPDVKDKAPGADDDASGVATILETFRVLMEAGYQPDRTLEFMTYAGEELGLLGSQDIAEKYKKDGVNVVGVYQMDMTLFPGPDGKIRMISDHTDRSLNQFTESLIDTYVQVPWIEMPCTYGCSDHASWSKAGYAATFPFEAPMDGHDPKIHTEDDTVDLLTPSFGMHFAKLTLAYALEMATN